MPVASLSPVDLRPDVSGHAHPSQATTALTTDNAANQRLIDLLAKVAFDVETHGLAASSDASIYEMYRPKLRKSDVTQQAISHLDTISCWRGISYAQALELTLWDRLFHHCLVSRIEQRLKNSIVTQLKNRKDRIDDSILLPYLIQSFPEDRPCLIDIELACLFRDMTDAFCKEHPGHITARNFPWSFGSGNLPSFVYNYLSAQDCFQNTQAGPCVFVNCSIDWFTFPLVAVTADVAWHPPAIEFQHVPAQIRPRAYYVIAPCRVRAVEDHQESECQRYPEFVEYIVTKSASKIQWDQRAELFRAQAPDRVGTDNAAVPETILQAKIITRFPGNVRFESISRYAIKTKLVDTENTATENDKSKFPSLPMHCQSPHNSAYLFKPWVCQYVPASFSDSLSQLMDHRVPPFSGECYHEKQYTGIAGGDAPRHNEFYSLSGVSQKSSKKRSKSLCESNAPSSEGSSLYDPHSSSPDTELKRRKLAQMDATETYFELPSIDLSCPVLDETQNHDPDGEHCENTMGRLGIPIDTIPVVTHPRLDSSSSEMQGEVIELPSNTRGKATEIQCPTPPRTPLAPGSNNSDPRSQFTNTIPIVTHPSPVRHTRTGFKFSSQLSQQTIQCNYHEFEEMALRKLTDPPCSGDMSFERIFLSGSEASDWHSSDLDGVSDEVNDMETEL